MYFSFEFLFHRCVVFMILKWMIKNDNLLGLFWIILLYQPSRYYTAVRMIWFVKTFKLIMLIECFMESNKNLASLKEGACVSENSICSHVKLDSCNVYTYRRHNMSLEKSIQRFLIIFFFFFLLHTRTRNSGPISIRYRWSITVYSTLNSRNVK